MEITQDIKVDINELYLLKNLLTGINYKAVKEYFTKKSHISQTSEYREGSEKYNEAVEADKKIASLPDHNIKNLYCSLIITSPTYEEVKFDIMQHTYKTYSYEEDDDMYEIEYTKYFVTDNSHHGFNVYGDIRELLNDYKVTDLLFKSQKYNTEQHWYEKLQEMGEGYTLLYKKVLDAITSFKDVTFYSSYVDKNYKRYNECVIIDKDLYVLSELNEILAFKNSGNKLYDENDRVVSLYSYDYIDAYKKYYKANNITK